MIKKALLVITTLLTTYAAQAYEPDEITPNFLWANSPSISTGFDSTVGVGLFNDGFISSGTSIFIDASGSFAINPRFGLELNIPVASFLTNGGNGFGLGNISLEAMYLLKTDPAFTIGVGAEVAFGTSTQDATFGTFTRNFYRYMLDTWSVVPTVMVGSNTDRIVLTAQVGAPLLLAEDGAVTEDQFEAVLSYDVGAALPINDTKDIWVTVETGGYSTLTYTDVGNNTELFGSVGAQYQDDEKSFGLSVALPFTETVRNIHTIFFYSNFAYRF